LAFVVAVATLSGALSDSASSAAVATLEVAAQSCAISGPVVGLSSEQAGNAEVVVSVAMAGSGESTRAAQIAVMVALTESGLNDLGPQAGNLDSLGLFQQRASQGWGTAAQELDPAQATAMFVARLVRVPSWTSGVPWGVAQAVQRSAVADGSNYEANWTEAAQLLNGVLANGNAAGGCGQGVTGGEVGPAARHGLPVGYAVPSGTPPSHAAAVGFALAQLGKSYVWGAAGPASFDCSGLTMAAWASAGVALGHYTVTQSHQGQPVTAATLTAGDLVLTPGSDPPGPGLPGHVGIYLGDGLVLSAIDPAEGVAVQSWQTFVSGGLDGLVDPAPGQ
jgi:cell wall-associated NlpC family hydrolase